MHGEAQSQTRGQRIYRSEGRHTQPMRGEAQSPWAAHIQKGRRAGTHTANARGGTKPNPGTAHIQKGRRAGTHSQCAGRHTANPRDSAYTEAKEGRHTQPMRGEAQSQSQGQRIYRREGGQAHTAKARGGTKPISGAALIQKGRRAGTHTHTQPMHREAQSQSQGSAYTEGKEGSHTQRMPGEAQSQTQGQRIYRREGGQAHTANARGGTQPIPGTARIQKRRRAGTHSQSAGRHKANPRGSAYTEGKEGRQTQPMRGEAQSQSQGQRIYRREGGQAHTTNARGGTKPNPGTANTRKGRRGRRAQPMHREAQSQSRSSAHTEGKEQAQAQSGEAQSQSQGQRLYRGKEGRHTHTHTHTEPMRGEAQSQSQGQRNYRREGGQAHTANARGGTKPIHLIPGAAHIQKGRRAGTHSQCAGRHKANPFNPRGSASTEGKEGRHTQPMRGEAQSQSQGQRIYRREGGQAHTANARGGTKPIHSIPGGSASTEGKEGRHTQPMRGEAPNPGQVRGKVKLDDSSPTRTSR